MPTDIAGLICFILVVRIYCATGTEAVCGFPGSPAYGYVKLDQEAYKEGDVVTYSCRVGYILLGSSVSRCTEDGSWTQDVPICDASMTALGVAFSTPTVPGHAAEMAIDRDKETCSYLKPKKPRWWRIDLGNVQKVLSVAVTMNQPDKNVKFTIFVIKTLGGSASYRRCASFSGKFGTQTVVMACAEGKGIVGEKVHIEDHLQTEGLFEICEVEVHAEKDTGYDCGRPSRNLYSITYTPRGGSVTYSCIRGYEIRGKHYRNCLNSGQWSEEPPVCEPIVCDDLEELENGDIKISNDNGTPLEGAIAIYKCDKGYKLLGSFTRNCLNDGSWSGKTPQCKAIRCPVPDGKDVGGIYRLVNKTNSMGSMALLRCKKGKREGDNPYISCTEDGSWTEPESHCILPAGATYERKEEPRIVNQGAIIFGMIVAAVMIIVVLVAMYLYTQKRRNGNKPDLPSRLADPPVPPPRPPPRSKDGGIRSAFLDFISRDGSDKAEDERGLQKKPDGAAVVEIEAHPVEESKRKVYPVPEENETPSQDGKDATDYAAVDYNKKKQSRQMKQQTSVDSSSSDKPKSKSSPTPPKDISASEEESEEEEEEEEESDESVKATKTKEEEMKAKEAEKKAKEEEERKVKEEEERKAKEEAQKKEDDVPGRRRRTRNEPAPVVQEEEKPVQQRLRRLR